MTDNQTNTQTNKQSYKLTIINHHYDTHYDILHSDGILSKLFRDLNDRLPIGKENEMRWVVFDGDVDALWVENMNSGTHTCILLL